LAGKNVFKMTFFMSSGASNLAPFPSHSAQCGLLLQIYRGLCVYLLITTVSPTEMVEPVEMPFGVWTRVGPMNVLDPPTGGGSFEGTT